MDSGAGRVLYSARSLARQNLPRGGFCHIIDRLQYNAPHPTEVQDWGQTGSRFSHIVASGICLVNRLKSTKRRTRHWFILHFFSE
jgi:hypothetical protein